MSKITRRVQRHLNDPERRGSFSQSCRRARFSELLRRFPEFSNMRVLDLGGTPGFWYSAPVQPAFVTTVNLGTEPDPEESWLEHVAADACRLDSLDHCAGHYDLVFSNSLIEHVGGYQRRRDLADVATTAATRYWVQTPDRYFPIEPHFLVPGLQFLPVKARAQILSWWPLSRGNVRSVPEALTHVLNIDLIGATELQHLFPAATIWHERLTVLSKSLVAVKQ